MIRYASRTGTKRNLAALRDAGWRLIISATGVHRHEGFRYAIDNGAWTAFNQGIPWDEAAFEKLLKSHGPGADWIALPDIVCGGMDSLDLSRRWLRKLRRRVALKDQVFLIPVQNGMDPHHIVRLLGPKVGIFVGGDDTFKEGTMAQWALLASQHGAICHVGRVNTVRRIRMCEIAGVTSFDGTSCSMYAVNVPKLTNATRQMDIEGYISRQGHFSEILA
jgi:hypothetical protein